MKRVRQAVVVVHGMGEQRPLDTLNRFIEAALAERPDGQPTYYSQPDRVTDSFESRRYLARRATAGGVELHAQTEFYEYHWAHLMQGNRIGDLAPVARRVLFRWVTRVPAGLRAAWVVLWTVAVAAVWAFWKGPLTGVRPDGGLEAVLTAALGTGALTTAAMYVGTRLLPGKIANSFVDVVRYLDTSPRSYEVRREIRKGMVDLLQGLHASGQYARIVVVAHSLGAYIAYDGISYLWAHVNKLHARLGDGEPAGLAELERLASELPDQPSPEQVAAFQRAQRDLWCGLRGQGNPWLVTDFVSVGTPMYFADQLYARTAEEFGTRVARWEFPTCPPQPEGAAWNNTRKTRLWFSWRNGTRRVLYHGAPFAAVRWTNLWFPARFGVFGDWFGGPLAPLFGPGIKDVPLTGNTPRRYVPALAHTLYFSFPRDHRPESVTTALHDALDLAATSWLEPTLRSPEPDEKTGAGSSDDAQPEKATAPSRKARGGRKTSAV